MANKIIWINFLHIYQPPWQSKGVIDQISSQSYEYLIVLLEKYPNFTVNLNISGSLVEQLSVYRPDLLKRLKSLIVRRQVELTASSQYHALLPLLPPAEIKRQIQLNQATLSKYFSISKMRGFYLPEMAYSDQTARIIKQLGFQWIILDPIHCRDKVQPEFDYIHKLTGLRIIFRDRQISKAYPAEVIFNKLKNNYSSQTIITATDGEIYGHFHEDWQGCLEKILLNKNLSMPTVSQYLKVSRPVKKISLRSASWESLESEIKKGIPFALWDHPNNKIHRSLWSLVDLSIKLVGKYKRDKDWFWARQHLDKGLASCTFWWASARKPSDFSPLTWNPDMIDSGAEELIRAARSLSLATSQEKVKAEKLYLDIKKNTWFSHWNKYNRK